MDTEQTRVWRFRGGDFRLGERTLLMGIVNVTPDSFSDGGEFLDPDSAIRHALCLQDEGADLIDIGAESTRPGSSGVPASIQVERLLPVLRGLRGRLRVPLSVDTTRGEVARAALEQGAAVINDVSGFRGDETLPEMCAAFAAGVVLMHMRGTPADMQRDTHYEDLLRELRDALQASVVTADRHGIPRDRVLVDPGLGFGKTFAQNHRLIAALGSFRDLAAGVLVGPSRKAFTAEFSGLPGARRQFGTAAALALCVLYGADVIRVHDVAAMREVTQLIDRHRELVRAQDGPHLPF